MPNIIAHRGSSYDAPENTLAAFREGARHGWRAFECDVKLSSDDVPFLLHDATLERTTSGSGSAERTWAELSRLDAGGWHGRTFAGEPLPTLEAVARWVRCNGFGLDIEIKPLPDMREADGWLWSSQPVAVRAQPAGMLIQRTRETVSPAGVRTVEDDEILLTRVLPGELEACGLRHGLRVLPRRAIPETDDYVGSEVVVLGG